jgi:threonine aldolase
MNRIDLRSDTVTHPTLQMREAMAHAAVGDDVYGDDPTVILLEEAGARILQKEAALFVVSGTMGNQLAIMCQTERSNEIILPDTCHVVVHEAGAAALLSGVQLRCQPVIDGLMDLDRLEATIRKTPEDIHSPRTALLHYEQADSDGRVLPLNYQQDIRRIADRYGVHVHIDGARLFNAASAMGVAPADLSRTADTVTVCLSKALCAPVGSILAGPKNVIDLARRRRKILGGGWRQAGILAAAGLIALENMTDRLVEDHRNATYLADQLRARPDWFQIERKPQINMVFFRLTGYPLTADELVERLSSVGVLSNPADDGVLRWVTHFWITRERIEQVIRHIDEFAAAVG